MSPRRYRSYPASRMVQRGRRPRLIWSVKTVNTANLASGGDIVPLDLLGDIETGGVGFVGGTVRRIHLALSFAASTSDNAPGVTWGILIWDTTTAEPSAASDLEAEYMMWRFLTPGMAMGPITAGTSILYGAEYDIKSQRRLRQLHDRPVLLLHNGGSSATVYSIACRTLIALP